MDSSLLQSAASLATLPNDALDAALEDLVDQVRVATGATSAAIFELSGYRGIGALSYFSGKGPLTQTRDSLEAGFAAVEPAVRALYDRSNALGHGIRWTPADDSSEAFQQLSRLLDFQVLLAFPLVEKSSRAWGLLTLGSAEADTFPPGDPRLVVPEAVVESILGPLVRIAGSTAAQASHARLERAGEIARIGAWEMDLATGRMFWSDEVYRIFGVDPEQPPLEGEAVGPTTHPDDREIVRKGSRDVLLREEPYDVEHRLIRVSDGEVRWLRAKGEIQRDVTGKPKRLLAISQDITTQKLNQFAREKMEAQLQETHRMESLGRLAGGVAHDFNNLLGAMIGRIDLALETVGADSEAGVELAEALSAGEHAHTLINRVLSFSRSQQSQQSPLDLGESVENALALMRPLLMNLEVIVEGPLHPVIILGNPTEVQQVLINLCQNAEQAMLAGGCLTVTVESDAVELAKVTVADNGCGIDPDMIPKVFEPYVTTKAPELGTGLGLSIVHGIVTRMNGRVRLKSQPGKGCTVVVELPLHTD